MLLAALSFIFLPPGSTRMQATPPWWNLSYTSRFQVTVRGGASGASQGDVVAIPRGPGNSARLDWRLLAWDGTMWHELPRAVVADRTWFRLQANIPVNAADGQYWLYSNNPGETTAAPHTGILRLLEDFTGDLSQWQMVPEGGRVTTGDGLARLVAPAVDGSPNSYLISHQRFGPGTMVEIKARSASYTGDNEGRYGRDVDFGFATQPLLGDARWRLENYPVWQRLVDPGEGFGGAPRSSEVGDTRWRLFQIARYPAHDGRVAFWMDDNDYATVQSPPLTPMHDIAVMLRTYDNISGPAGVNRIGVQAEVDWVAVFEVAARQPAQVLVGGTEGQSGSLRVRLTLPQSDSGGPATARIVLWPLADAAKQPAPESTTPALGDAALAEAFPQAALLPDRPPLIHYVNLDTANSATLPGLPPGSYMVEVSASRGRCLPQEVVVAAGHRTDLLSSAPLGDLNGDGQTTVRDQALLATAFPATIHTQMYNALADLTRDGSINEADLHQFAQDWRRGQTCTPLTPRPDGP